MIDIYRTVKVKLETISDVQKFVNATSKYPNLDLHSGHYIVPANSLIGIFSLDLTKPIKLSYPEDYENQIREDFVEWIIK